jgi:uncharacterized protein with PIN domain
VLVRCYAELNDYLPEEHRQRDFPISLSDAESVGGLIASLRIPVGAVEVILVNGSAGDLGRSLRDGDRVSLYPLFESLDVTPLLRLRPQPLRRVRFVADAHLGRLARYLRLLGFDALFENDPGDAELARICSQEGRILLSRDRRLLERRIVTHGLWIPSVRPREQLVYLVDRLSLYSLFRPFTRCTVCNGLLSQVNEDISDLAVPPRIKTVFGAFWRCDGCGRVYWRGSHYERLHAFVDRLAAGRGELGQG